MPHIVVKCLKGRDKDTLQAIADKIAKETALAFNLDEKRVSLSIEQYEKEEWQDVYKKEVTDNKDNVYVCHDND